MSHEMRKRNKFWSGLRAAAILSASLFVLPVTVSAEDVEITIYHTNDMHANVLDGAFNLAQVAALKSSTPDSLLLDCGDAAQGLPIATISEGNTVIQVMNAAGYDAATLGNHEFDFGQEALLKNLQTAEFDYVSANLSFDERALEGLGDYIEDYTIKEIAGKKIAIFGITTPETAVTANPAKTVGINFNDITSTVETVMEEIKKEEPDAVICLSHCGWAAEDNGMVSNTIAAAGGGEIDVILDGHSHETFMGNGAKTENGALIAQTGSSLGYVGKVTLDFTDSGVAVESTAISAEEMAEVEPDPQADALMDAVREEVQKLGEEVIGVTKTGLYSGDKNLNVTAVDEEGNELPLVGEDGTLVYDTITRSVARYGETNMAALVADAKRWSSEKLFEGTEYDSDDYYKIGIICGGGVRTCDLPAGDITMEQAVTVLPFGGDTVYVLISPKTLYQMVEVGVSSILGQDEETGEVIGGSSLGRYLIPSGFSFTLDYSQPANVYTVEEEVDEDGNTEYVIERTVQGTRCLEIVLDDGTVLDPKDEEKWIILPTGTYNLNGGDDYWCFMEDGYTEIKTGPGDLENTVDYIKYLMGQPGNEEGFSYPFSSGRISTVNFDKTTFDVKTTVVDGGAYAAGADVEVYVNDELFHTYTTDENGAFTIEGLQTGPQEIYLKAGETKSKVYYIDNFIGFNEIIFEMAE